MNLLRLLWSAAFLPLLVSAALGLLSTSHSRISKASQADGPCTVAAWVRAEDLSPHHIAQGELRVKVSRSECAHQIVSVALRLQLNEFGEFVSLRAGVVLPEPRQAVNETVPGSDVVYDYQPYADAMSDPELWNVRAEERQVWVTETMLLDDNPDLTHPIVTPFTVAVPAVNYPPATERYRLARNSRHFFSDLTYQYIAIVRYTDGRTVDVPAGYTTFIPEGSVLPTTTPFSWNTTFVDPCGGDFRDTELEKCLPSTQRSEFVAEITLEEGNVVQKGGVVKGRVSVHSTAGSTTLSEISVGVWTRYNDHWAEAQAAAAGDTGFSASTTDYRYACRYAIGSRPLDAEASSYAHIFANEHMGWSGYPPLMLVSSGDSAFTPAHPHFDFEFQVPHDIPVDFASYYTNGENQLLLNLEVLYASEVADCLKKPAPLPLKSAAETAAAAVAATEERLWDSHTRVGHPVNLTNLATPLKRKNYRCLMTLQALMPIIVMGSPAAEAQHVVHYLGPNSTAPVLRRGSQVEVLNFPATHPVVSEEPLSDTIARLLQPRWQSSRYNSSQLRNIPDLTQSYRQGHYAGLLWKKKVVAEERGILPLIYDAVEPEGGNDQQIPLSK
ncbi:hypothetical protein C8R44DRAFT_336294 [Mycena epipterygia]|nr:hypothetical protein C8R44DRAFT_336294 [Mycena epipterygia]